MLNKRLISSWHWSSKLENPAYLSNLLDHGQEEINFLLLTMIKRGWKPCAFSSLLNHGQEEINFFLTLIKKAWKPYELSNLLVHGQEDLDQTRLKILCTCQSCSIMVKKKFISSLPWSSKLEHFVNFPSLLDHGKENIFLLAHDWTSLTNSHKVRVLISDKYSYIHLRFLLKISKLMVRAKAYVNLTYATFSCWHIVWMAVKLVC